MTNIESPEPPADLYLRTLLAIYLDLKYARRRSIPGQSQGQSRYTATFVRSSYFENHKPVFSKAQLSKPNRVQHTSMASLVCSKAAPGASIYIQIAKHSVSPFGTPSPLLNILAPRFLSRLAPYHSKHSTKATTGLRNSPRCQQFLSRSLRRPLATTATRGATSCVHNPQRDEEDEEMLLEITERAGKVGGSFQM